jgi:hypothetical protein
MAAAPICSGRPIGSKGVVRAYVARSAAASCGVLACLSKIGMSIARGAECVDADTVILEFGRSSE